MAIACFLFFTRPPLPPLPERSFPRFARRTARSTLFPAAFPYFATAFLLQVLVSFGVCLSRPCDCRDTEETQPYAESGRNGP
jgi:hypothetical protein